MADSETLPTVVLAGATGFVGTAVRKALAGRFRIVGLTRSASFVSPGPGGTIWRRCDLFSLLELEEALRGADYAIYLVHSMMPSARLLQGSFSDLDLLMADNFARAAQHCKLLQIIYLGGLIPGIAKLSPHLSSRLEVEETLRSGQTPVTALRAGLAVGPGGSSLRIVVNLVRRLPVMILPKWTETRSQPIAIDDVVRAILLCLGNTYFFNDHYDIGGPEVMSYRTMLERTAEVLGRRRLFVSVPFFTAQLSKSWVALLGGSSRHLASPLVDSLRHPMIAQPNPLKWKIETNSTTFAEALKASLDSNGRMTPNPREPMRRSDDKAIRKARRVRSVQRLPLPRTKSAHWVAQEYYRWMPELVRPFLRCNSHPDGKLSLSLLFQRWKLIEFTHSSERSSEDRQLFYITAGWLAKAKGNPKGRIEFREMLDRRCLIVAIHDYIPRLPWFLYRRTQAIFHLWVMHRFGKHLSRLNNKEAGESAP